jgi:hypothetical protein
MTHPASPDAQKAVYTDARGCLGCGRELIGGRRGRIFCQDTCRATYWASVRRAKMAWRQAQVNRIHELVGELAESR